MNKLYVLRNLFQLPGKWTPVGISWEFPKKQHLDAPKCVCKHCWSIWTYPHTSLDPMAIKLIFNLTDVVVNIYYFVFCHFNETKKQRRRLFFSACDATKCPKKKLSLEFHHKYVLHFSSMMPNKVYQELVRWIFIGWLSSMQNCRLLDNMIKRTLPHQPQSERPERELFWDTKS